MESVIRSILNQTVDILSVEKIILNNSQILNYQSPCDENNTLLGLAIIRNKLNLVHHLLTNYSNSFNYSLLNSKNESYLNLCIHYLNCNDQKVLSILEMLLFYYQKMNDSICNNILHQAADLEKLSFLFKIIQVTNDEYFIDQKTNKHIYHHPFFIQETSILTYCHEKIPLTYLLIKESNTGKTILDIAYEKENCSKSILFLENIYLKKPFEEICQLLKENKSPTEIDDYITKQSKTIIKYLFNYDYSFGNITFLTYACQQKNSDFILFMLTKYHQQINRKNLNNLLYNVITHFDDNIHLNCEILTFIIHKTKLSINDFLTNYKETFLHLAVKHKKLEFIKILLFTTDLRVNIQDHLGNTPFHYDYILQKKELLKFAIHFLHLNVFIKNNNGQTIIDVAKTNECCKKTFIYFKKNYPINNTIIVPNENFLLFDRVSFLYQKKKFTGTIISGSPQNYVTVFVDILPNKNDHWLREDFYFWISLSMLKKERNDQIIMVPGSLITNITNITPGMLIMDSVEYNSERKIVKNVDYKRREIILKNIVNGNENIIFFDPLVNILRFPLITLQTTSA